MSNLLRIYHRLPPPLRSMAATVRGYYLRSWRYGTDTSRRVQEALDRESWTDSQWHTYTNDRLTYVLTRAATQVPYYRQMWEQRRRHGDMASWLNLENWPVLEKETLRDNPRAFVADDCHPERMFHLNTSGTTGKSLDIWFTREGQKNLWALSEARWRMWYGVSRRDRWAILGGQLVTPVPQRTPPFWTWNAAMHQLYMSSYHLAPDLIPHYLAALRQYNVRYLRGYSSSLFALAQEALRLGVTDLKMQVAITNAEPLFDYQRQAIEAAFHCPVRETYGMCESVAAASECDHGRLHQWPEAGILEIFIGELPAPPGVTGDFVCTGLLNADMPLIRYRVGDSGSLPAQPLPCPCGRTLPLLGHVEGRVDDVLYTPDGRMIGRLDPVFKTNLPIREAQIIQETLHRVRLRYVPATGYSNAALDSVVERLKDRMGEVEVITEEVAEVPRGANGKFRAVICDIPAGEKERLRSLTAV